MSLVSCGKDVDPSMDKVELSRLLNNDEINEVFKKIEENFSNKLSGYEANYVMTDDDLVDQKEETTIYGSIKIKGDEYAETKAEMTSKVTNGFYSYTDKTISEGKVAAFGEYYVSMNEQYKDGKKDDKDKMINFSSKGTETIVDACSSLPFSLNGLSEATFGVDKRDNVYVVYSSETIATQQGIDKDGKDAAFLDKNTYEIFGKLGNLKDPKVESYKVVNKHEANYDKELKTYKDYRLLESNVVSYKFEYKNRGKNDGKDKFISALPDKFISATEIYVSTYGYTELSDYTLMSQDYLSTTSSKIDYDNGTFTCKRNNFTFYKDYAYSFDAVYRVATINKSSSEVSFEDKQCDKLTLNTVEDVQIITIPDGNVKCYKAKNSALIDTFNVNFLVSLSDNSLVTSLA